MMYSRKEKAILVLEDGSFYEGKAIGKKGTAFGEICFNTAMTGYQELYTDPSYYRQIVVNTMPHIGNYGVKNTEQTSKSPKVAGIVVNDFSWRHSRKQADGTLQDYLLQHDIVGLAEIDTRQLVVNIRDKGAVNAVICSDEEFSLEGLKERLKHLPLMEGLELSSKVTTKSPYLVGDENKEKYKVAVLDLGVKTSILKELHQRECCCKVFPARTTFEEIEKWKPDGYFLSNGPGDPSVMQYAIDTASKMLKSNKPIFGICLGHQILIIALGGSTYKMHHGHRGVNHPIKNLETGLCEITSQNHGFCVLKEDVEKSKDLTITHVNLNDNTVAGIQHKHKPVFSVQYHPEATPGPNDSKYLFDKFIKLMSKN